MVSGVISITPISALHFQIIISVFIIPLTADTGLWFVRSPEPIVAPPGDEVMFECSLNIPWESVKWRHNSEYLPLEHLSSSSSSRQTTTSYRLVKVVDQEQAGDYQCIAWYGASALASIPAKLTLAELKPFSHALPRHYTVSTGNTVAVECPPPVSYPPPVIQYYKNNERLPASANTLSTTGTLILSNVTSIDSGVYTCSATNYITGQTFSSHLKTALTVAHQSEPSSPRFLYTPQSTYIVQSGTSVSLECSAVGNPSPQVTWRRVVGSLPKDRTEWLEGALKLNNVQASDDGEYICELTNGISPSVTHKITVQVQEPPVINREPASSVVEEGGEVELECEVEGAPFPSIIWLLNGESVENDSHIHAEGGRIVVTNVEKRHAGILQCMATNNVGSAYGSAMLQVSPKQVTAQNTNGEIQPEPDDTEFEDSAEGVVSLIPPSLPTPGRQHAKKDHTRKGKGRRKDKKHKGTAVMIPPTRPNITRLSDKSVMVRWSVPINDGLPIQFFKVQYRELGGPGGRGRGSRWMTSNEDIPPHIRSYEVDNLETDHIYRFRIAAVYSNNDNKLGPNSARFHLHRGSPTNRSPLSPPSLTHTEAISPSAIQIHWQYLNSVLAPVDGFYVYYRTTSSAGDYIKATVEGENTRSFIITHLLPDTAYDIKLQAFTVGAASDFSAILTHKTLKEQNVVSPPIVTQEPGVGLTSEGSSNNQLFVLVGVAVGGVIVLIAVVAGICIVKNRSSANTDTEEATDKAGGRSETGLTVQQLDPVHINGITHNGKVNGFSQHTINITSNPLAETSQDKNEMEMSYVSSQNNNCSAEGSSSSNDAIEAEPSWRGKESKEKTVENYV